MSDIPVFHQAGKCYDNFFRKKERGADFKSEYVKKWKIMNVISRKLHSSHQGFQSLHSPPPFKNSMCDSVDLLPIGMSL
jgi:hypothetical protein